MHSGGSGEDDKMAQGEEMQKKSEAYNFDPGVCLSYSLLGVNFITTPDNVAPPEVQKQLWDLLKWRDGVYRDVIRQLSMIPGLTDLIDNLTDALNACE
jgi:hypothetical protein